MPLILAASAVTAGCGEDVEPCVRGAYHVRLGALETSPSLTYPDNGVLDSLGEGWEFTLAATDQAGDDHETRCLTTRLVYESPPDGYEVVASPGGNSVSDGSFVTAGVTSEDVLLGDVGGCRGGVTVGLMTPYGSRKVEDARRRGAPIVAHLCFMIRDDIASIDTDECRALEAELGYFEGCVLRQATLTPVSQEN